jgi:hypothetical protein
VRKDFDVIENVVQRVKERRRKERGYLQEDVKLSFYVQL